MNMSPEDKAKKLLSMEVYYWGDKGLETTQRCVLISSRILSELIEKGCSQETIEYWYNVGKEIYKQGK